MISALKELMYTETATNIACYTEKNNIDFSGTWNFQRWCFCVSKTTNVAQRTHNAVCLHGEEKNHGCEHTN